jgi:uncharacterized alpha-E superfamily protein
MMLSRTALNLYWIGRYMERAESTARLLEATIRLSALTRASDAAAANSVWESALAVVGEADSFAGTREKLTPFTVNRYLALAEENSNSIRSCIFSARDNARAARNALTKEVWEAINRAWLHIKGRASPGGAQTSMSFLETLTADTRGFEGALSRMLRSEAYWFMRLGSVVERADNTARLLDVKYYLLLPEGQHVGGALDRDQWTTLLQTVSARNAYRLLYRDTLKPWLIADLLILRKEMPRSLSACATETVELLNDLASSSGRQGEADRLARRRLSQFESTDIEQIFQSGLHEFLHRFIAENIALDQAIAQQFRFG